MISKILLTVAAAALMLTWFALALRGPRRIEAAPGSTTLHYGALMRILALALALTPPVVLLVALWQSRWSNPWLPASALLAASAIVGLWLLEVERVQVVLDPDGITRYSPWVGIGSVQWQEIESIDYSSVNQWFVVRGAGRTIRISRFLVGMQAFHEAVRRHVTPERWTNVERQLAQKQ